MAVPSSAERTLVLGTAIGYGTTDLKPFLVSLREAGYRGDVCLFIAPSETTPETIEALRATGVIVEFFETWRFMPMCIHAARRIKEFEFLIKNRYDRVFLTDTRDVFFQNNPFAFEMPADVVFFAEEADISIGACASNSAWVRRAFGDGVWEALRDKTISCGGTVLGTYAGIMRYLKKMVDLTGEARPDSLGMDGIDQSFHLRLIHDRLIDGFAMVANGRHVNTLGHVAKDGVRIEGNRLVNRDGSVSAVIHQYTYPPHEDVFRWVRARYCG